jgi:hypothetical protein
MANFKRKHNHRKHKGCGLCDIEKRLGNGTLHTKPKYRPQDKIDYDYIQPIQNRIS